ncbi:DNA-directed RNA polymerase, mitochondrial [Bombyx mori]|uniref:DNA-directed RNA polymerase n=1 Tax=Bombyx mori TaxID=7091 RepID=A0A8R1WNN8_BOMMO|nr:DNA-directed RNA polymerase, mitochondrial [Bombyx mori]
MHRLISARSLYQSSLHGTSVLPPNNSTTTITTSNITCSFCRKILLGRNYAENIFSVRHQSTKTASILRSQKKKAKHKGYKKYGEVLEVGDKAMTEMQVSISKLHAAHLSKLAASPVSLGQLHQLTTKPKKPVNVQLDTELLQRVREKILNNSSDNIKLVSLEDDKCALIYTHHKITNLEEKFKKRQFIDMVRDSYHNFRKATLYDQRLSDLSYAINEGVVQEFQMKSEIGNDIKSPHAAFKEFFVDNHLDRYDHHLMSQITSLHGQDLHPALEDLYDEGPLHSDGEIKECFELDHLGPTKAKPLNVKAATKAIKEKKKASREKRRALKESNMKQDIKQLEQRGKQEAFQKLFISHLQLLCSLHMINEGRRVLLHYRRKSTKPNQPKVTDVKIYNTLLHGYAKMGMLEDVKELLSYMTKDNIQPDAQTFAAVFECIERSANDNKSTLLHFYHNRMQETGISLNDLMDKTTFQHDQHETVLSAIQRIQPGFQPQYTPPILDYECTLLEKLKLSNVENRLGLLKSPSEGLLTREDMLQKVKEQIQVELKGEIEVENINVKDVESKTVQFCREKLQEIENEWRVVIKEAFVRNIGTLKSQSKASHSAISLYPYLKVLEVDQFVELVMSEISKLVDGSETYSPTLKVLQRELGTLVYQKYQIEQYSRNGVLQKIQQIYEKYCDWYVNRHSVDDSGLPYNGRQVWQALLHKYRGGPSLDMAETPWPMEIRQNIGKFLYNIIINDVKIDVNLFKAKANVKKLPAVYKVHRPWGRAVRLELKPHPALCRVWEGAARPGLRLRAALVPAAAPPAPWAAPDAGAYLLTRTSLIRMPHYIMNQWKRIEEAPKQSLYPVLDSLNQLGEVPWVINTRILDLQLQIFRSGGNKKLDIPPPASSLDTSKFQDQGADSMSAFKRRLTINRARAEMHSLWCDMLYKLSLANYFRERTFWLPHNMDFRGRVYACGPHVSVLGADAQRALLRFAQPRPLGPDGLRWLKLHAVNLTGALKKSTIQQRLEYAESITDMFLDSADNPLEGKGWWTKSEEPWQTLACCIEIANAIRSPNPEEYMCGFPVHQDGSCNGLQHYAALGGDEAGAAAVNLAPGDRPCDVYSAVAALVEEMRARDAAAGVGPAIILENFVRRKVIKQTVMTTVYGVTKFGARLQIAKQLKDIDDFPKEHVWACSQYLTAKTFDSLREMFTSTKQIQDWFTDCAKVISGVCGESVEWVTSLGLPVVQPYYRRAPPHLHFAAPVDQQQRPCTMKQRNAFPPNFIHSLDSTHMMLTGLHCAAAGLSFVSVHDCFWTHPDTVHRMNKICREQFVALHSQPILEDLSNFLVQRFSYPETELQDGNSGASNKKRVNNLLRKVPSKGNFDINSVLDSVYFFS